MSFISCKDYAQFVKNEIKEKQCNNSLHIFQIGDNPASNSYIKGKMRDCEEVGIKAFLHKFDENISQDELTKEIRKVNSAVILQMPVPSHINAQQVIENSISSMQDVDGFLPNSQYISCTPRGIVDWLEFNNIDLCGKNVVIIGRSDIVGKPLAKLMTNKNSTVTLCHSYTCNIEDYCKMADIIIVAIGQPKWFNFDLSNKPIIIDVGINRVDGKLCGDVDYDYMTEQGCYVTSVPGGVGLLTRVSLLKNIVNL